MTTQAVQKVLDSRHIPEGYRLVEGVTPTTSVYYKEVNGRFLFLGFWGRSINPTKHCYFTTEEQRQRYTDNFLTSYKNHLERVEKRRIEKKVAQAAGHGVQVGDIFTCSWGYDQTNIDYYQVTELIGKTMVKVREIASKIIDTPHFTYHHVAPVKDSFLEKSSLNNYKNNDPVLKKVSISGNSVSIKVYSFASAYRWDGKPQYETDSQFGH